MASHPWPYLADLFRFIAVSGNTYRFRCILCEPKVTECAAYHNSPSNLKKHVERMHPAHLDQYSKLAIAGMHFCCYSRVARVTHFAECRPGA